VHGVQFHPESIASEHGHDLLRNFLRLAQGAKHLAGAAA
jgi:anthranilate synthase component 2